MRRLIADWKEPSAYSVICSDHFTEDCFEGMLDKLDMKMKRVLKADTVSNIFPRHCNIRKVARVSTSYAKRERARVSLPRIQTHAHTPLKRSRHAVETLATLVVLQGRGNIQ